MARYVYACMITADHFNQEAFLIEATPVNLASISLRPDVATLSSFHSLFLTKRLAVEAEKLDLTWESSKQRD